MKYKIIEGQNGEYVIGKRLGHGGVGIVYEGKVKSDGTRCAIKMLRPHRVEMSDTLRLRFKEEIELLCKTIDSQYIVKGLDYAEEKKEEDKENIYLIMEWLSKGDLTQIIADQKYDTHQLTKWICQLLKSFRDLRKYKIIHRDIKTNNIFIADNNDIKLGDFGIAKSIDKKIFLTLTDDVMGSVLYVSPKQREDPTHVSHKDDFYSLCCVMFELISGIRIRPFLPTLYVLKSNNVPLTFARLVDRGLQYTNNWEDVYQDMCEIYDIDNEKVNDKITIHYANNVSNRSHSLRILHLVYSKSGYGGIETYIDTIKRHSQHIHFVKSVFEFGKGSYATDYYSFKHSSQRAVAELKLENRNYEKIGKTINKIIDFLKNVELSSPDSEVSETLKKEIEERSEDFSGFDMIHSHFVLPAYFSQRQGFITLCTSHSLLSKEILYSRPLLPEKKYDEIYECSSEERIFYREVKNLIVLSASHKEEIEQISGRDATLMEPIFDVAEFENPKLLNISSYQARKDLCLPDKTTILFIGRPAYRKGLELIIEALSTISGIDFQLLIVGKGFDLNIDEGYLRYGSEKIILNKDIIQKVLTPIEANLREKIILLYKAADIVVCPSLYEPFGYINIESMAAGRPVVAANTDGIKEIIKHEINGLLFKPGDIKDLKEKIELLLRNASLRERFGRNGHSQAKKYKISEQIKKIDSYYENIFSESKM